MTQDEQVLVVERKILEQAGMFQGLSFDVDRYLRSIFVPNGPRFMARAQAESDHTYKQIIPYVIITHDGKYLCYARGKRAGEGRLVGHSSIGIGGHINPEDNKWPLFGGNFQEAYARAVKREVTEEVFIAANYRDRVVALLNDDSNEVGRVHLGIVHCWTLDSFEVSKREQMITKMAFMSPDELQKARATMETWSTICLNALSEVTKCGESGFRSEALFTNVP